MGDLMDDYSLIGDEKMVIEMSSNQVPKLIGVQFHSPSNVRGKNKTLVIEGSGFDGEPKNREEKTTKAAAK